MSENDIYFSSDNIDDYLKELAKEYRKLGGKNVPAEITLVGGAAILANYGFREKTYDIDAIIHASSAMKDAANNIGDKYGLPDSWFNSDFKNTDSYSPKLEQYSKHYRTYANIVDFRTVSGEYLIAMKLMSGRPYKHDLSDVAEILAEHQKRKIPISQDTVTTAITNLYGNTDKIPESSMTFLEKIYQCENIEELIQEQKTKENQAKMTLTTFEKNHQGVLNNDNLNDILKKLNEKNNFNNDVKLDYKTMSSDQTNINYCGASDINQRCASLSAIASDRNQTAIVNKSTIVNNKCESPYNK